MSLRTSLAAVLLSSGIAAVAVADDGFNPFSQPEGPPPVVKRKQAPAEPPPRQDAYQSPAEPATPPTGAAGTDTVWPDQAGIYTGDAPPPPQQWPTATKRTDAMQPLQPPRPTVIPPIDGRPTVGVERGELAPILKTDGSGLPFELWRGLDVAALEGMIAKIDIPPKSPAVHELWRRLITSNVTPPAGVETPGKFDLLRAEMLLRSGLLTDASRIVNAEGPPTSDVLRNEIAAKILLGLGQNDKGCEIARSIALKRKDLPKPQQSEALLMAGLCAAAGGNTAGAGLVADLAREDKTGDAATLAILDAVSGGLKTPVKGLKSVSLLVYRTLSLAGGVDPRDAIDHGEPALLAALARDTGTQPGVRTLAAEAGARVNALTPAELAAIYRETGTPATADVLLASAAAAVEPALHRATLFRAAESERTPLKKVRLMRALLDDARRAGLYLQTLSMLAPAAAGIQPVPEIGWFAESGVEIALAAGQFDRARQWSMLGGAVPGDNGLRHWQALIDLSDPAFKGDRARSLQPVEELVSRGRLSPDLLNRLATVLDANDINVPIPIWQAASRVPPSAAGFLPETGVLTELQDAAKKQQFGRTVLLVMRALGKTGAEGAHMIALGDSIRALRKAGLDADAKRLSMEALFAEWPRNVAN